MDETPDSDHSKTAVLNLGKLVPGECGGVLTQAERVEGVLSGLARGVQCDHLDEGWDAHDSLEEADPEEKLDHGALGYAPGVDVGGELGGVGVEREGDLLADDHAEDGEHADAA